MRLIVTEPVYRLLSLEASQTAQRLFLCRAYLEAEGGEPSWGLRTEATHEEEGIKLECGDVTLWCTEKDESLLNAHILLKDPKRGLVAIPAITFHG